MKEIINRKWSLITHLNKEFEGLYHKIAGYYNMSDSCFWVLYVLYEKNEPCSQKEICDYWYYSKQTINSAIKSLEKSGYVQKGYPVNNKVNKKIGLTESGMQLAENTVKRIIEIEDRVFKQIGEEELDNVIAFFQTPLNSFKNEVEKILL